jgi:hypothetical protein
MNIRTLMIGAALTLAAGQAFAADAPPAAPMLVRGTIASINGATIVITKNDGGSLTGTTVPMTFYAAVEPRRFDQIKATDFVGITSVPGPNDTLVAKEIHILPIHIGEGSYPWDHLPDGTKIAGSMTNGTVAVVHSAPTTAGSMTNGTVTMSDGWSLKVTYRGSDVVNGKCVGHAPAAATGGCTGVASVAVTPSTPIVAIVPAKPTDAKTGLAVFANVATGPDGKPVVASLVLEKNGIKPQM